jgi:hypothetical protein
MELSVKLSVLHERLRWRLLKLLGVDRRRGRILGRGGRGVGHGGLAEGRGRFCGAVNRFMYRMFGSGFRSVTGQFPVRAVFAPQPSQLDAEAY